MNEDIESREAIAIIGMSGRFPDAECPDEFWQNLLAGKDSITRFPGRDATDGNKYVGARGIIKNPDKFDASFFGIYPKEAELMDPQHRVFLECSWEALEDAGYDPARYEKLIGVYAGLSLNTYLLHNIGKGHELAKNYQVSEYQTMLGNDKDFLPVRISYKLNLRGPSMAIQSACSTSLVAICQAATALLTYQCDMALTGGVSLSFPQHRDYLYQEEGMVSPDGTVRAFDAEAAGTVFGHGCGVILIKRLSEAIADRDPILAVIKGWAVNNDGSDKIGFAAPSINAQADVISMAHASAGISPSEVSYIEAHGTGTPLGDPIEIAALTKAFREGGAEGNGYCSIGTGKTHIGHLDCAAGVTGVIKTIQQFRHQRIPALLHFKSTNPRIDFANSPFAPAAETCDWLRNDIPRIAGVSAFGVGGTNAHVVMEESPDPLPTTEGRSQSILALSAKSTSALTTMAERLANHLEAENHELADVAFTLATGRGEFSKRTKITASTAKEAITKLREIIKVTDTPKSLPRVVFLFPGQGAQYVNMGRDLYESESVFKNAVDDCAILIRPLLGHDIRTTLYPTHDQLDRADQDINQTIFTQPCIFTIEYALAKLWISWGVQPSLLLGHSIGEYVAAVIGGTFKLESALHLLVSRAKLMQELPSGGMLAVRASPDQLKLPQGIDLAAINSPNLCTVSGPIHLINSYQKELEEMEISCRVLKTSHAFHSSMMESIMETFREDAQMTPINPPNIPWISTYTGKIVTSETIADPDYWALQLRHKVDFYSALTTAFTESDLVILEVGPGKALSQFAMQHPSRNTIPVVSSLPNLSSDMADITNALGSLWENGANVNWNAYYKDQDRARLRLPTYPFERQSYWIDNSEQNKSEKIDTAPTIQNLTTDVTDHTVSNEEPIVQNRLADISGKLRALVTDLSGIKIVDDDASFTELGFDSLFLTQASQAIRTRFGIKITFRQMLGELSSISQIACYLDLEMPEEKVLSHQKQLPSAENTLTAQTAHESRQTPVIWPNNFPRISNTNTRFGPYKPIEKGEQGGLTALQQKNLDELIQRYTKKTLTSKAYAVENRPHYADPRAVSGFKSQWKEMVYPIVAKRTKNATLWDIDDNEYVDITMGFGTYFFGHSPDWLIEALEVQLRTGIEIGPQSPIAGKLAKAICELTGMERATFCNTGSEAVMAAMRLARTITGRDRIAYFTGDYHGMFEEVLVRGNWVNGIYKSQPIAPGIPQSLVENILVLDYADPASLEILRAHAHELAAVMIEPVQSRAPGLQPREFMHEVRAITQKSGSALIFDEVVTGFRCAPGGAQAYFGVEADLATYGKVIGGGMPIGVLAGKKEYMDALDGGSWNYGDDSFPEVGVTFFAGTFVRHPLALAAAWRVVEYLKGEGPRLQIDMEERVARLCRTLNHYFTNMGIPIRIPHFSAYAVIEHAQDLKYASLLWYILREKGIHVWEGRPLYFTTAHTDEDFDKIVKAFIDSVSEMQAYGFFPASKINTIEKPSHFPRFDSAATTEAQKEIFHALQMGDDANCSFNESNVINFNGNLDFVALRQALADIITRHPALRSNFSSDGNFQYFHPSTKTIEIMEHDFTSISRNSPSALMPILLIKSAETSVPFDLTEGPLIRLHLISFSPEKHQLLFTAHHMICDGWSFGMILSELAIAYNARKSGQLPRLKPAMSYADYARSEELNQGSTEALDSEIYWVNKFSKGSPTLDLPTDRSRPPLKTYSGAMESISLDTDRYARLKSTSSTLGGTLFVTLLSSFATLLHRLTGQDDLVIGIPAAGQTRVGCNELVGHCLNFLPLRLEPNGNRNFREFATDVKELVLEAYDHQDYTFGSLLKKLTLPRDPSRLPLVSVMFNIDKSGIDQVYFDGLNIHVETNPKQFVNFDIFFNLVQTDANIIVECEYNTDLFDQNTIRRWLRVYEQLIESIITDGNVALDSLPILDSGEKELCLNTWNATKYEYPKEATLHSLFSETAKYMAHSNAITCGNERMTYRDLDTQSTYLASRLQTAGVKRGDLVGIHLERSCGIVTGLLAILKCGAAYVPLDPAFPKERLGYMVDDAHMKVILSQSSIHQELPPSNAVLILVDNCNDSVVDFIPVMSHPEDTAYVIFTSGSTGRPKGVRIPHRAVVNFLESMRREPGLSKEDILLSVTTLSFDISGLEIFLPLTTGAQTVIAKRDETLDGQLLAKLINHHGITVLQATPATWRLLLEAGLSANSKLKILIGGEAVPRELVNRLAPLCGEIWNVYGPTETTIWSTVAKLSHTDGPVVIGRPIANTQVYVVNSTLQPQPIGISGELLIGGDGLATGYHELPELTSERFIESPFIQGAKLYRTGDIARWTSTGDLECLGRMDNQVKVRGYRIELGEIETLLEKHPAIEQAVTNVRDGKLTAYFRTLDGTTNDLTQIWQDQWNLLYQSAIDQTGTGQLDRLDSVIAGWAGGQDIDDQVSEWIETTVDRINMYEARRIFEIGCGTGQILTRLAKNTECYWAADISSVAIEALHKSCPPPQVKLFHRPADDFDGIPDDYFDTVIVNSVAQYFPDADYFRRVLEGVTRILKPGGRIFLGDIQSNALLTTYHAEILSKRALSNTNSGSLRESIARRVERETELSIDPGWFALVQTKLPGINHVETLLRRGKLINETTIYHYDVVLHKELTLINYDIPSPTAWSNLNLEQLEAILFGAKSSIYLTGIPDSRLAPALAFNRALMSSPANSELPLIPPAPMNSVSAEDLFQLACQAGLKAHVRWQADGTNGLMEALFVKENQKALPAWTHLPATQAMIHYANTPYAGSQPTGDISKILRKYLSAQLPDYMIPSAFVMLEKFPLTPNGKVDRKSLPEAHSPESNASPRIIVEARNSTESVLLEIWRQVIGRADIGVEDDIFELGGDSILIFQITTRATRAGLALTPAQVFRLRSVASIASSLSPTHNTVEVAIQPVNRDAYKRKL